MSLNAAIFIKTPNAKKNVMAVRFFIKGKNKMEICLDDFVSNPKEMSITKKVVKMVEVTGDIRATYISSLDTEFISFFSKFGITIGGKHYRSMESLKADFHVETRFFM